MRYGMTAPQAALFDMIAGLPTHSKVRLAACRKGISFHIVTATLVEVVKYSATHPGESLAAIYAGAFRLRMPCGVIPPDVTCQGQSAWARHMNR